MSKKYQYCECRQTDIDKQHRQRGYDKLFKEINGYTNPPRKKENERISYMLNNIEALNKDYSNNSYKNSIIYENSLKKDVFQFLGMGRG